VSAIVPAYRAADFIGDAVASILGQTFGSFELIVVNDGSPDTERLERALQPYRDRIRYLRQENQGPAAARNAGLRLARGELVAFLDADDVWLPEFLESQIDFMERTGGADLVYADALLFGDARVEGDRWMEQVPSRGPVTPESLVLERCVVNTSTVLARRRVLVDAGLFDEDLRRSQDFDLWLRLALEGGRIEYQRRPLARRRIHSGQHTAGPTASLRAALRVFEKHRRESNLPAELRELVEERIREFRARLQVMEGKRRLLAGDYGEARERIAEANRHLGRAKLRLVKLGLTLAPGLLRRLYVGRREAGELERAARSGRDEGGEPC
jgi:glycosyltransferase involved in cell wall biosynthesis